MGLNYRTVHRLTYVIITAIIIVVIASCILWPWALLRASSAQAIPFIRKDSAQNSRYISSCYHTIFSSLETFSDTYARIPEQDRPNYLAEQEKNSHVLHLRTVAAGEVSAFDKEPFFQQALAGGNSVSALSAFDNTTGFIFAVPYQENEATAGVLLGYYPLDTLRELLFPPEVNPGIHTVIAAMDGTILLYYPASTTLNETNLYTLLQARNDDFSEDTLSRVQADVSSRSSGVFDVQSDRSIVCYDPILDTGWYLFSIVPADILKGNSHPYARSLLFIVVTMVLLFVLLIILLVTISHKRKLQLEQLSFIDPITGGMSTALFDKKASELLKAHPPSSYALVFFDIQRFKLINNAVGSSKGDEALKYIYNIFASSLAEDELISHIAGDQFNLLLRNESRVKLVERIEAAANKINAFNEERANKFYLPVRAGIYIVDDLSLDLIAIRDRANVAWKNNGDGIRNRTSSCAFYTDFERLRMLREKEIDGRTEAALEKREFDVYFQPKYALATETLAGAEALVRWNDPERGIISPADFIPVLEKNNLIGKLDLYVFETVCRHLQEWQEQGRTLIPISVNLSRVYLQIPGFLRNFKQIFNRYSIPPEYIEFEITETVIFEDLDAFIHVVDEIHSMGFTCSLDDFGSGYSSLNVLKNVPVDVLKLDRAFLNGEVLNENREHHVVESVIDLAHKLNMQTVCEGVETIPQLDFLKHVGCDIVQGYVYSRPLPLPEFEQLPF